MVVATRDSHVCAVVGKRGKERVLDREISYWELLGPGIGLVEASRLVGASRKAGYRWSAEMGVPATCRLRRYETDVDA